MSKGSIQLDVDQTISEFETLTKNAKEVQAQFLKQLLEQHQDSEYLKRFGLNGRTDPDSFKTCVPFATHEDIEPYIQRIADGDKSHLLVGKPITTLSMSSGTSKGKTKLVPFTEEAMDFTIQCWKTSFAFRNREFPITEGKALQFIYSSKKIEKNGILIGQATTNVYRHPKCEDLLETIKMTPCTPYDVIFGPDFHQCLYCHLLCALIYREDIHVVTSSFAHSIVSGFKKFEQVWEELVNDIKHGVLSSSITDPSIRESMSKILKPDPALADLVNELCQGLDKWHGLIPTLFPNVKYIHAIMTGAMEPYLEKLRVYAGDVPLVSGDYGASEGWFGVNVDPLLPPEQITYTALPNLAYYEFLPFGNDNNGSDQQATVALTDVEVGQQYEVIISNHLGLYRYRIGDIVKIEGFHNSTPKLKFVSRSSVVLSVATDKTTERDLQAAIEAGSKVLCASEEGELVDYTSQVDRSTEPGHYIIYWEVAGYPSDEVLLKSCNELDLGFTDMGYISSRRAKVVGPVELRVLKEGTISKLVENFSNMGGAVNQFKMPRYLTTTNTKFFEILSEGVLKNYYSTAYA